MEFDYEALLKEAKKKLPQSSVKTERFEIPRVQGHLEGNKTVISNFTQILSVFQRDEAQLLKYLQRELATPAKVENQRLVLGRKLSSALINEKVDQFAADFVICKECGKPDTKLLKEDRLFSLKCTACGAKQPVT